MYSVSVSVNIKVSLAYPKTHPFILIHTFLLLFYYYLIWVQETRSCTFLPREQKIPVNKYRRSSDYDNLDLRCFEVTNASHKNTKNNNIEAVKLDYCDQELQYFHTAILG